MNLKTLYKHDFTKGRDLHELPNKYGSSSGYFLIAIVKTLTDKYVCFTDETSKSVWIEKLSLIRPKKWTAFEDLVHITDDEEFNLVHSYLVKEGVLDEFQVSQSTT